MMNAKSIAIMEEFLDYKIIKEAEKAIADLRKGDKDAALRLTSLMLRQTGYGFYLARREEKLGQKIDTAEAKFIEHRLTILQRKTRYLTEMVRTEIRQNNYNAAIANLNLIIRLASAEIKGIKKELKSLTSRFHLLPSFLRR